MYSKIKLSEILYIHIYGIFGGTTSLKSACDYIVHLNADAKFSLKILDLHFDFIQFTVEQVHLHTQVVPNIIQVFQKLKAVLGFF